MTLAHISALYFSGRSEMAKKRLQRVAAAGLVGRVRAERFKETVYRLCAAGAAALSSHLIEKKYPIPVRSRRLTVSERTLRHELAVMDVKVAISRKAPPALSVDEFTTWPALHEFEIDGIMVKPDGFFRVSERAADGRRNHAFFLELDRSTEAQAILTDRAIRYLNFHRSGGFAVRNGAPRSAMRQHPFRALYVLKTAERRNNTIERLLASNPPVLAHVWLTTLAEVLENPFGAIWVRPCDYRDTVMGTEFGAARRPFGRVYQRNGRREAFVDANVAKRALIEKNARGV
jgi:hypothetical protein